DLFDDPAFDYVRQVASQIADYIRRMGPFQPHRLPPEEMEYTALPKILAKIKAYPADQYEKDRKKLIEALAKGGKVEESTHD
ncbi:MAG: fructose 1,6-bisphosphatase, partial [Pyrobaculum sp.]